MSHSGPNFPDIKNKLYKYPATGNRNGQTAICISIGPDKQNLDNIAQKLLLMEPHIYKMKISDDLISESSLWKDVRNKNRNTDESHNHLTITSRGGFVLILILIFDKIFVKLFQSFAKSGQFSSGINS